MSSDDDFQREAREFFKKQQEEAVDDLQEALRIERALKLILEALERKEIFLNSNILEVVEILEKKKRRLCNFPDEDEE